MQGLLIAGVALLIAHGGATGPTDSSLRDEVETSYEGLMKSLESLHHDFANVEADCASLCGMQVPIKQTIEKFCDLAPAVLARMLSEEQLNALPPKLLEFVELSRNLTQRVDRDCAGRAECKVILSSEIDSATNMIMELYQDEIEPRENVSLYKLDREIRRLYGLTTQSSSRFPKPPKYAVSLEFFNWTGAMAQDLDQVDKVHKRLDKLIKAHPGDAERGLIANRYQLGKQLEILESRVSRAYRKLDEVRKDPPRGLRLGTLELVQTTCDSVGPAATSLKAEMNSLEDAKDKRRETVPMDKDYRYPEEADPEPAEPEPAEPEHTEPKSAKIELAKLEPVESPSVTTIPSDKEEAPEIASEPILEPETATSELASEPILEPETATSELASEPISEPEPVTSDIVSEQETSSATESAATGTIPEAPRAPHMPLPEITVEPPSGKSYQRPGGSPSPSALKLYGSTGAFGSASASTAKGAPQTRPPSLSFWEANRTLLILALGLLCLVIAGALAYFYMCRRVHRPASQTTEDMA